MEGDSLIGTVIAGHRIEALVGEGGMGVVYRARHEHLGKVRALKLLPPQLAQDKSFRDRFEREWRLAASIDHPNIVEVLDAGEANEHLYILMRLIDGPDLSTLVRLEGTLATERTFRLLEQVADALDAAHSQGLIHRDVTPRNVLIGPGDRVYLADFGVARTTATHGLTRTGLFVGNLEYAAPEQIEGRAIDSGVDIYALGGVLYTCLTGRPPFVRDSDAQLMNAHLHDSPPLLSSIRPELPPSLDGVVQRAMAKPAKGRYESCGELVRAARAAVSPPARETVKVEAAPTVFGDADGTPTEEDAVLVGVADSTVESVSATGGETVPLRIFINYRRGDSSGYAGRLYDALDNRSEDWHVFMDIDAIEPGADFVEAIDSALDSCDVVIALIGRQWISVMDARGQRRLNDPSDFVRLELAKALERKIRVIPALVQGIEMPDADEFPDVLAPLARRHALELSDARWRYDVDRLVHLLKRIQQQTSEQQAAEAAERRRLEQERMGREKAEREAKEAEAREAAEREAAGREAEEAARKAREAESREAAAREAAAREAAEREAAEREAHEAARRQAREAKTRKAAEQEAAVRETAEREARSKTREREPKPRDVEGERVAPRSQRPTVKSGRAAAPAATIPVQPRKRQAAASVPWRKRSIVLVSAGALALVGGGIAAAVISLGSSSSSSVQQITPTSTSGDFRLIGFRTKRPAPVPGEPFDAQVTAVIAKTGKPVPDPTVSCQARAGTRALGGTPVQVGRQSQCRWNIPFSVAGARLTGSITVRYLGVSERRAFRTRVGPVPQRLVISRAAKLAPTAGIEAKATFVVRWVRKDGKRRRVEPTATHASCRATIPAYTVKATTAVTPAGVVCRVPVPIGAGGKTITIALTVRSKGQSAQRTIGASIAATAQPPPPPQPQPPPPGPDPCDPLSPSYDPLNPNCP